MTNARSGRPARARSAAAATAVVLLSLLAGLAWSAGEDTKATSNPATAPAATRAFGIEKRVPWTTSRVAGSPEPADPFVASAAYPKLKFDAPLHVESSVDGKRWFVCQHMGLIYSFPSEAEDVKEASLFLDVRSRERDDPAWAGRRQIWSMTFHPKYAENGYVYVCYHENKPQPNRCRISRYTVTPEARTAAAPTCDPNTEFLVCEWPAGEDHFGGCMKFGPDGMLYFSAGDGSGYADGNQTGQNLSDLNASILRIDVDHPPFGHGYGIPADNPFVKLAGARPEVYAYGLRNVWKFSIDAPTGNVWAADVGQDLWEPIVLVAKGGNYGWSVKEGSHDFRPNRKAGPTPILKPVWEHEHSEARSVTGGFVYHGKRFPELAGQYVYGDYETGKVWALAWDGAKVTSHKQLVDTPYKLVAFGQGPDGELLLLDYQGTLHRLDRNPAASGPDASSAFPRRLSETGLFASTAEAKPAAGVIPYDVNSPLWSDGATKQRYIAVPGDAKVQYRPNAAWQFPEGSVLVKTFSLPVGGDKRITPRRLETRLLHIEQGHWRGYTYVWNDAQTDADLLDDPRGLNRTFDVADAAAPGGTRKQVWHFPSRAECTLCHTMPSSYVLGLRTTQMNRDHDYDGGATDNQLRTLSHIGLFDGPILPKHDRPAARADDPAVYDELPRLPDPRDTHADLNGRARSYLDTNCAHCHQRMGGGNALFELNFTKSLADTKTVDVRPQHGEHGLVDGRLLRPGDPTRSLLLHRMRQTDETRMPRVGSNVVDEQGVRLIEDWIRRL